MAPPNHPAASGFKSTFKPVVSAPPSVAVPAKVSKNLIDNSLDYDGSIFTPEELKAGKVEAKKKQYEEILRRAQEKAQAITEKSKPVISPKSRRLPRSRSRSVGRRSRSRSRSRERRFSPRSRYSRSKSRTRSRSGSRSRRSRSTRKTYRSRDSRSRSLSRGRRSRSRDRGRRSQSRSFGRYQGQRGFNRVWRPRRASFNYNRNHQAFRRDRSKSRSLSPAQRSKKNAYSRKLSTSKSPEADRKGKTKPAPAKAMFGKWAADEDKAAAGNSMTEETPSAAGFSKKPFLSF